MSKFPRNESANTFLEAQRRRVAFVFRDIGPYHADRIIAAAEALGKEAHVHAIAITSESVSYGWPAATVPNGQNTALFSKSEFKKAYGLKKFCLLFRACWRADDIFVSPYDLTFVTLVALFLRLTGTRTFLMMEAKIDDNPRNFLRELGKVLFLLPYRGALVGGNRSAAYARFLGFREKWITTGYDTVSVSRIRKSAKEISYDDDPMQAPFVVVARLIPKKNLNFALTAYRKYVDTTDRKPRRLEIYGSGPEEDALLSHRSALGLDGLVLFHGWVQSEDISGAMANAVALILPSLEEQFGLVVNEAIAVGTPVLISDVCGARDHLVRNGVNGFIFEPDNSDGLAYFMRLLAEDEDLRRRLGDGTNPFREIADTGRFGEGVRKLMSLDREVH